MVISELLCSQNLDMRLRPIGKTLHVTEVIEPLTRVGCPILSFECKRAPLPRQDKKPDRLQKAEVLPDCARFHPSLAGRFNSLLKNSAFGWRSASSAAIKPF